MITASVVLYDTKPELIHNVISSYHPCAERKLFLIDNSEHENDQYKKSDNITYIFNGKNIGYGHAHNIGIKKAIEIKSDYHIVLNPDLQFETEIIDELITYADEHKDVVYMLPKVIYSNGRLQYLCKLLPTPADLIFRRFLPKLHIIEYRNDRYILKKSGYDRIMNPPCLSGCFMFMRTSVLERYSLFFDERFFMYCEDFDLMRRLHRVGKTIFYPRVTIVHDHEHGSYKNVKLLGMHMKSAIKYFNKYGWIVDKERNTMNQEILEEIRRGRISRNDKKHFND